MSSSVKILIVDVHRIFREGLRLLFDKQENFQVIGEAGDEVEARAQVEATRPNTVIMDHNLLDADGMDVARDILAACPETKIIILSADVDAMRLDKALRAGVAGYVSKDETSEELVRAIRATIRGRVYLSPIATTVLVDYLKRCPPVFGQPEKPSFSDRDITLLKLIVDGLRNKEIADRLGASTKAVESQRARLMAKTSCTSPAELVRFALKENLVAL